MISSKTAYWGNGLRAVGGEMTQNRKIDLPSYCCPHNGWFKQEDRNCDHDFDPESKHEEPEYVCWTCTKCGGKRCYEIYQ